MWFMHVYYDKQYHFDPFWIFPVLFLVQPASQERIIAGGGAYRHWREAMTRGFELTGSRLWFSTPRNVALRLGQHSFVKLSRWEKNRFQVQPSATTGSTVDLTWRHIVVYCSSIPPAPEFVLPIPVLYIIILETIWNYNICECCPAKQFGILLHGLSKVTIPLQCTSQSCHNHPSTCTKERAVPFGCGGVSHDSKYGLCGGCT